MKITTTPRSTTITQAQGAVWRESFTFHEAEGLVEALRRLAPDKMIPPIADAAERLASALYALTNDSSACIVTVGDDEDA